MHCSIYLSFYKTLAVPFWSVEMTKSSPTSESIMLHTLDRKSESIRERSHRPRVGKQVEDAILEIAFAHPAYGQDRVSRELRGRTLHVSASGVRYVLQRHNLETMAKRVRGIEENLGKRSPLWTVEQCIARDRVRADRKVRSMAVGIVGHGAGEVSRSSYILAVAARLLREQSFDATSLRDIAKRAQIPLGSMYYHFQTREELFASVYEEGINRLIASAHDAISRFDHPWDRIQAACVSHLQYLCGGNDFSAIAIPTNLPRLEGQARHRLTQVNDEYEDIFRQLIAAIDLPADVSASLIRLQLLGALNWTGVWFKPGKSSAEDIAKNLICALRQGLERPGAESTMPGKRGTRPSAR